MQKIWQQPFPSPLNITNSLRMSFIAGSCVFCVLYFIQPFGIDQLAKSQAGIVSFQYAMVTILVSLLCNTGIPLLFPKFFQDVRWTVLYEIIFLTIMILIVTLGNILFTALKYNTNITIGFIIKMVQYTLVIGVIPIVISVLIKQQQLLMMYRRGATEIETLIAEKNTVELPSSKLLETQFANPIGQQQENGIETPGEILLQITGTNYKEILTIAGRAFLFAEASNNYTAIHYVENDIPQKVLYRTTIKNLENQIAEAVGIIRCHKSYLVNLNQVIHISGNAQGYKLHLRQNKFEIPVSRNLNSSIKENFAALKMAK